MSEPAAPASPPEASTLGAPVEPRLEPVSPRLAGLRLTEMGLTMAAVAVAAGIAAFAVFRFPLWLTAAAAVVWLLAACWWGAVIVRQVKHLGYAQRESDLLIERGILIRSSTVVPYGRLQFVDVVAGPLDRAFGLANVKLHTASAGSDAVIPGLPHERARALREALAARGEAHLAGL
ncbi:PH domain-containing protein [Brevibacterium sp. BRM-1]|uniref:PH domain-containing protein n=1 Tax=Brevibacterium sp. BRM-1 TaxID=2999062 RepID=UPI00227FB256|nr:PH domain-containing protein [Brevibacterium sp. BRM-1]WAL39097.1 PH domain-containing protein [Brevibacterium sp. BRM-1]